METNLILKVRSEVKMKLRSQQYYSMMAFAVLTVMLLFANAFVTTYIVLTLKLYKVREAEFEFGAKTLDYFQSSLFSDDGWGHASMLHTSIYAESVRSEGGKGLRLISDKEVVLSSTAGKAANNSSSLRLGENSSLGCVNSSKWLMGGIHATYWNSSVADTINVL